MWPSFGSTSRPAEVPHLRPAGSSPQLRVTFGAGFGSPSPEMGFAALDCADSLGREPGLLDAISRKPPQAPNAESRIRGLVMTAPLLNLMRGPRGMPNIPRSRAADSLLCEVSPRATLAK